MCECFSPCSVEPLLAAAENLTTYFTQLTVQMKYRNITDSKVILNMTGFDFSV